MDVERIRRQLTFHNQYDNGSQTMYVDLCREPCSFGNETLLEIRTRLELLEMKTHPRYSAHDD